MFNRKFVVLTLVAVFAFGLSALAAGQTNLALSGTVNVDSAFSGYSGNVLNDGELNDKDEKDRWAEVAWASQEIPGGHWAEVVLAEESEVTGVSIYWARDLGKWWSSSNFTVQYWDGNDWVDLWSYKTDVETYNVYSTEITFVPVTTSKIRVVQPEGGGPIARPNLMWLAEIQVWGK